MFYPFKNFQPEVADDVFIAPGSHIIGRVWIGEGSSIWFNCVLRGDVSDIRIGRSTNIQDGCILHGASVPEEIMIVIGNNVTIGHGAVIHACHIEDGAFIGMGAIILNGARVGKGAIIGAGTVVPEKMVIPPGVLAVGIPARIVRAVSDEYKERLVRVSEDYRERARMYRQSIYGPAQEA